MWLHGSRTFNRLHGPLSDPDYTVTLNITDSHLVQECDGVRAVVRHAR